MKTRLAYLGAATATAAALMVVTALPASAAQTGDTAVTFSLGGGTLDIAVPTSAALTNGVSGATSITGTLGATTVTDNRGLLTGWTSSAASTAFISTPAGTTSTVVTYGSGTITKTGFVTTTSSGSVPVTTTAVPVVVATLVQGVNTATWNPTLTVTLPATSTTGAYAGTVTTSVA